MSDAEKPLRVAFPLGIGDCHWALTKMRALSRYHGGRPIHGYINTSADHATLPYLKMAPQLADAFVSGHGRYEKPDELVAPYSIHTEMTAPCSLPGKAVYEYNDPYWSSLKNCAGWKSFDYLCVVNPHIERGDRLENFWPELGPDSTEFTYELSIPQAVRDSVKKWGEKRVLLYPSGVSANMGFHSGKWTLGHWAGIADGLNRNGIAPVMVGAASKNDLTYWKPLKQLMDRQKIKYDSAVGQTSLPEYLALIDSASCWIGLNSGGGIYSAMRYTPTVMLWCDRAFPIKGVSYNAAMVMSTELQRNWLREDQMKTYRTLSFGSPALTCDAVVKYALEVRR